MKALKKHINPQNLISISVVVVGLLAIFEVPQNLGISQDKIVLALLSLLAVDFILVNVGFLEDIKTRISHPNLNVDDFFVLRDGKFAFSMYEDQAKEVFLAGVALQSLIEGHTDIIKSLLRKRCKVRIVLNDPTVGFLDAIDHRTANFPGIGVVRKNIDTSMARLKNIYTELDETSKNCLELRVYGGVAFYSGMRVVTKDRTCIIWIAPYAYGKSRNHRRGFILSSENSSGTYSYFKESFDNLWQASDAYTLVP